MSNNPPLNPLQPVLTPTELALFFSEEARTSLPEGAVVIQEGLPGDEMFVLLEGELVISIQGKHIDHLTPGMILGEMAMVDDRPRSATAIAVTDCTLIRLDRARFLEPDQPVAAIRPAGHEHHVHADATADG